MLLAPRLFPQNKEEGLDAGGGSWVGMFGGRRAAAVLPAAGGGFLVVFQCQECSSVGSQHGSCPCPLWHSLQDRGFASAHAGAGSRVWSCHPIPGAAGCEPLGSLAPLLARLGQPGHRSQLGSASFTPGRNPGGPAGLASHLLAIKTLRGWESISSELSKPRDEPANERCSQLPAAPGLAGQESCLLFHLHFGGALPHGVGLFLLL